MKRLISTVVLVTLIFMLVVPLNASEIVPYYDGVSTGLAKLSISNLGVALCTTTFDLRYSLISADIEMKLLCYETSGWTEVKTWSEHFGPSNQRVLAMNKRYAVPKNGIYRVAVSADIETSAGTDHLEPYSISVEYP